MFYDTSNEAFLCCAKVPVKFSLAWLTMHVLADFAGFRYKNDKCGTCKCLIITLTL